MLVEKRGEVTILAPRHRVDTNNSPEVEKVIQENIGGGEARLVLDFAQVDYVSSAGLRVLLKTAKQIKVGGGRLALCGLNEQIKEVMEVSGFMNILDCYDNLDSSIGAIS
ncbi:STAS domain-containing protein [Verrucomicrobiaceae bacterium N1E253]|uniref:Anti-sigma factor antagonist n=1 Tax=Oceaniferula marina TaxID=2748318 RepID=A0A851GGX7_9BACT|nr:STAS domain-containing protein [Oceaniferula marina]NWK56783.1 STAS domain-containing protein [Oceaniferula marina]